MIIETKTQYGNIPNGSILYVILSGNGWEEDTGKSIPCIKQNDKLYEVKFEHYCFSERNDIDSCNDDFSFIVIQNPKDKCCPKPKERF